MRRSALSKCLSVQPTRILLRSSPLIQTTPSISSSLRSTPLLSVSARHQHTFIEAARLAGSLQPLIGQTLPHRSDRFDACMKDLKIVSVEPGTVTCTLTVVQGVANGYETLHGGAVATLVDILGTLALLSLDTSRAGVSIEIGVTYCEAAKLGETVTCVGRVLKTGRSLGFTQVDLYRRDGKLVATGKHTKAFAPPPKPSAT